MPSIQAQDIGIIILAAGSSQRFQGDKRQALLSNGLSLLENTLIKVPATFEKKLLVLSSGDEALAQKFSALGWDICIAEDSQLGMGNSLAAAIRTLHNWQGLVIALGDMPFIKAATYSKIQQALCTKEIVIPMFKGKRGNPVAFQEKYFIELAKLSGDQGARSLLREHHNVCHQIELDDEGIIKDIDTSAALEEFS